MLLMAIVLMALSIYTQSLYRIGLAVIWLVLGLKNAYHNAVLEVTPTEIMLRNGLGIINKRYSYEKEMLSCRDQVLYVGEEKVYKHLFTFSREDFEQVKTFFISNNSEHNIGRHLIGEEDELE